MRRLKRFGERLRKSRTFGLSMHAQKFETLVVVNGYKWTFTTTAHKLEVARVLRADQKKSELWGRDWLS